MYQYVLRASEALLYWSLATT